MNKDSLLTFMIMCYLVPILIVCYNYKSNKSVSNIICNKKCKYFILFFMFLMGLGTVLYEIERNDKCSQILIYILLIGLCGLININEKYVIHYFFALVVFIAILLFMIRHCYLTKCNNILTTSLFIEFILLLYIIVL